MSDTQSTHQITVESDYKIAAVPETTWDRYRQLREESRQRLDYPELTNEEFISMLLDVWERELYE